MILFLIKCVQWQSQRNTYKCVKRVRLQSELFTHHWLKTYGRDMNLNYALKYELAPIPTSKFTNNGEMRLATSKSTLKSKLKVELTGRYAPKATSVIIDGSAISWVVHWPTQGTVQYLVGNVVSYVKVCWHILHIWQCSSNESHAQHGGRKQALGRHHQLSHCSQCIFPLKKWYWRWHTTKYSWLMSSWQLFLHRNNNYHQPIINSWSQGEIQSQLR